MRTLAALAVAVACAVPASASAQRAPPPPPMYAYGPQRAPWYVEFGLGSGNGSYKLDTGRVNYRDHGAGAPFQLALQLGAGATIMPNLLLGGELSGLVSSSSEQGIDYTLTVGQLLAVVTWFPLERGLFLRGGAGLAQISSEQDDGYGYGTTRSTAGGLGLMGGVGYAWWLGQRFNLSLHGDVNLHTYSGNRDAPSSSATFTGYLGFGWY